MSSDVPKETLLRDFGRALVERNGAFFIGAGMSRAAGFVDWRGLLKDIASDLGLDIDRETDLLSIAQFHENHAGNRGKINQALLDEFTRGASPTLNHSLIATLPINLIWTTNYDTLIEDQLRAVGRRPDVKHSESQLANRVSASDVTVLKMHGDITMPGDAVLTRDDYEGFGRKRQLFSEKLQGDLISQTFLFLGFSFTDPNIDYILSRVRVLLGKNVRNHFCVMRRPSLAAPHDPVASADFEYESRRLDLRIQDLKRYGIQTVLVDDFSEVTELLSDLNKASHSQEVFVSGSAHDYAPMGRDRLEGLCRLLGKELIGSRFNIVNGFGLGVGGLVSLSAIESVYTTPGERLDDRVLFRPFPQEPPQGMSLKDLWTKYRTDMISQAGHAVFIAGNKLDSASGAAINAAGVREEFEIAKSMGKTLIPIGASGWVAKELWEEVSRDASELFPNLNVRSELAALGSDASSEQEIVSAVLALLQKVRR